GVPSTTSGASGVPGIAAASLVSYALISKNGIGTGFGLIGWKKSSQWPASANRGSTLPRLSAGSFVTTSELPTHISPTSTRWSARYDGGTKPLGAFVGAS